MNRTHPCFAVVVVLAGFVVGLSAGCPDPKEVGAAPHAQVDLAKQRIDKAEQKLDARAAEATAATAD